MYLESPGSSLVILLCLLSFPSHQTYSCFPPGVDMWCLCVHVMFVYTCIPSPKEGTFANSEVLTCLFFDYLSSSHSLESIWKPVKCMVRGTSLSMARGFHVWLYKKIIREDLSGERNKNVKNERRCRVRQLVHHFRSCVLEITWWQAAGFPVSCSDVQLWVPSALHTWGCLDCVSGRTKCSVPWRDLVKMQQIPPGCSSPEQRLLPGPVDKKLPLLLQLGLGKMDVLEFSSAKQKHIAGQEKKHLLVQ